MAEPPIRRPADRPPPIPSVRGVLAPNAARTEVQPQVAEELPEDTRNLEAPDAGELVTAMLDLVATEAGALLARDDSDGKLADLNVRTALASWDALHQPDEAMRLLELAEGHPLVPRLRLSAAIGQGPDELAFAEARSGGSVALSIELAEAWLWRHANVDRAAELADHVLGHELPPALRAHVAELAALAHAAGGRWDRVVELRRGGMAVDREPEEVAASAALVLDRAGDAPSALAACWAKLEHFPGIDDHALGWLRTFDIAIAAASVLDDARRFELLEKRAELIAALPGGTLEALATRHAVASELDRDLQHAAAAAIWLDAADDPAAQAPGAARRIALLRVAWAAAGARDPRTALAAHRKLADSECSEGAATHAWRALGPAAVVGGPALDDLARAVVDASGSVVAERWLDQLEVLQPNAATLARFESRKGLALRWAGAIAERRNEPAKARQLWQDATAAT